MKHIKYILIILNVFLLGCLSEEEIKARQENAFDLSGTYQTTADSEVQLSFTITNQEGKHDILIQIDRTSPLSEKEKEFLSKLAKEHGIPEETLLTQSFPTSFGGEIYSDSRIDEFRKMLTEGIKGGDNISDNFGKTSRFDVCSDNATEHESKKVKEGTKNKKLRIFYCLSGVVKKENKKLIEEGELSLEASYSYDSVDHGRRGFATHLVEATLNYKAEKN